MQQRDSVANTIKVAVLLCVVCSVVVSASAVGLRSRQELNRKREMRKNILEAAGVYDASQSVEAQYAETVEARVVDLELARFSREYKPEDIDPDEIANDPQFSSELDQAEDVAGIKRRENLSVVYLIKDGERIDQIVLPIRGYGLWSTLRGFLAIDYESLKQAPEAVTIRGITYYSHGETPGLGGEVDNPEWKAKWVGKKVFDDDWDVEVAVTKGAAGEYEVDALSGATITSQGVTNMLQFWMGEDGFGPFLQNYRQQLIGDSAGTASSQTAQSPASDFLELRTGDEVARVELEPISRREEK